MGVGDDELHAPQAAAGEAPQEGGPEGLRFRGADGHAQHLAPAVTVDAHRDDDGHRHDPPGLAHLHIGGVDPEIRPIALDRALTLPSISAHSRLTWLREMPISV
jgi:hypothetical protein